MLEFFKSTVTDRWVFVLVHSLFPSIWVMIWTFSLAFPPILHQFYSLISSFSPPNHAGNLSEISFLSVWKKTCGAFIKTRSWIIHQVSEPSGPASSVRWTESTRHHPTPALVPKTHPARCHFNQSRFLHFTTKLEKPADCDHRVDSFLHDTGATICSQGPNLSVVLPPSKWTYILQKCQGRDWKNNNSLKRLWQSLDHLCASVMTVIWYSPVSVSSESMHFLQRPTGGAGLNTTLQSERQRHRDSGTEGERERGEEDERAFRDLCFMLFCFLAAWWRW